MLQRFIFCEFFKKGIRQARASEGGEEESHGGRRRGEVIHYQAVEED
jgi:hypothetical protein